MADLNIHGLVQMPLTIEQREIIRESARKCLGLGVGSFDGGYVILADPPDVGDDEQ